MLNKEDDGEEGEGEEDQGEGADFLEKEQLWTIIAQEDPNLLKQIGHQFEDFVVRCTFRGVYCE